MISSTDPVAGGPATEAISTVFVISSPPNAPITTGGSICIGSTANLTASGAVTGDRYLWYNANSGGTPLKTSAHNTDNTYNTPVLSATTNYWVSIINSNGCESSRSQVTATFPLNSPDSQTTAGTNSWIGHVYDGTNAGVTFNGNFTNYFGSYPENENFDQIFGGDNTCFFISSSLGNRSILTETFSVRYRMNSTKKGLYVVDLGSDDGTRLSVDGILVYNNWADQAWASRPRILMNLTGYSQLVYDYYENGGGNRVTFNNLTLILENKLTGNIDQNICAGATAGAIAGDTFGTLPVGLSGAAYQWTYSTSPGGTRTNITGATSSSFTPNINATPFNTPGTYYIYRNARLSSSNNVSPNPYAATNESNPAILIVKATPNPPAASNSGPVCIGSTLNLFASAIAGATYSWTGPNGFTSTAQNPQVSTNASAAMAGTYIVTATVNDCTSIATSTIVVVSNSFNWTGATSTDWNTASNWACNSLPTLETNVLIPGDLASNNYPVINAGTNAFTKNLSIENGASVIINDNWLRVAGNLLNSGILNVESGSVSFQGPAVQSIAASAFENNRILNLRVDNSSGVTSEAIIEVTGILKVVNGDFNTGNALSLISSAEKTALIDGSGNGQVTGTVTMQRYLDPAFGYKYFSSPFLETKAGDFTDIDFTTDFPNFYRYDENRSLTLEEDRNDATGWEAITDPASSLNILEGYALNFGSNNTATVVSLTGVVNNSSYSRTLENNNREFTRGFHLIGNPYPSPIDWESAGGWNKINIENGIYFFTSGETQYTGTYSSYVNGISSTDQKSSNIIPSMQGFFVKVTTPAEGVSKVTGSLIVTNEARATDFDQQFLKTPQQEEKSLLRLSATFEREGKKDAMVVYFLANSGTRFNKETDAHKLINTDASVPNLYSLSEDNINLSINAIPFPEAGSYEKIPLGINVAKSGNMHINLSDLQNIPANWNIYLIDREKRIGQNLRKKSTYSFNIKEGQYHDRFQLMFSKETISDPASAFDDLFSVDSREFIKVRLNLEDGQKGELSVSTVTGQLLEVKEGRGKEHVEFRSITSSGLYFINLYVDGQRYSKKVLVNK
ncbi:MAG TPA: T9SS type A sorting domain-containing protein [Gillisia sp.]|nr:T9SS type A sorting domain-containing protein [Gillisia sp.]